MLLRAHRHRLRTEDLEDCYSQATLELIGRARDGARYTSSAHLANTLEQRFVSRIRDRRRALSGRSPMQAALESAVSLTDAVEQQIALVDRRADLEKLVILRQDLRRVQLLARELSPDQRLILASQLEGRLTRSEFCERFGWSAEKYRKTAQRARARLRCLMAAPEPDVPLLRGQSEGNEGPTYDHISPHS
jgi:DNA-directed RNA polymerase specialized sigma24 family protein